MTLKRKKTIKSRWIKSILTVTITVLLTLGSIIIYSVYTQYLTAAEMTIRARISPAVDNFFSSYNTGDEDYFALGANDFVESFTYKDKMELCVLNKNGKVIASSNAFGASSTIEINDYYDALVSYNNTAVSLSETGKGERVLALSYILRDANGSNYGSLRYLVSLDDAYEQFLKITIIILLSFVIIIFTIILLGRYFVSSIVRPVEQINQITKEIAKGDFSVRIDTDSDDEIGELSSSINEMANRLNEIDNMKNEFISTVSHEIRTPLTAIKGWGETLKNIGSDSEITRKGLDIIISETSRLSDMVEELLDFSRMQSGSIKIIYKSFDLIQLLEDVCLSYKQRAETENKKLKFSAEAEKNIYIYADEAKIKQVFINLIDNAVKYTKSGDEIIVSVEKTQKHVTIYVEDTGKGISERDLPHIKEKFYKADYTVRGTGIGLAVADEIIKNHGGVMNISSSLNEGTTIQITLPIGLEV